MATTKTDKEKPLEKMTAKELREEAMKIPEITGVHGMNKIELISAIKQAKGIAEDAGKQSDTSVRDIKKKIRELKVKREESLKSEDARMAGIYRKRIIRLKKKTRKTA